jgi:hypothetical protein
VGQGAGHRRHGRGHPAPPLLTTDLLVGYDPVYKVNPPLRPMEDVEALRAALVDGTIDAVATDHAPHARHDKEHAFADAAFGMLGLETALSVVSEVLVRPGPARLGGVRARHVAAPHASAACGQGRPLVRGQPGPPHAGRPRPRGHRRRDDQPQPRRATTRGTDAPSAARRRRRSTRSTDPRARSASRTPTTDHCDTGADL